MCGRYSNAKDLGEVARLIGFISRAAFFAPRYNVAPSQTAPVIVSLNGQTELKGMRWGLIPSWAKDETIGSKLINARAETVGEKPSFKRAFNHQRCLIPADGFYEWKMSDRGKTPFRFTMQDGAVFCFAGLWERWIRPRQTGEFDFDDDGDGDGDEPPASRVVESFSIITTTPNAMVAAVHDRMPAILQREHWHWWLDERRNGEDVKALIRPYAAEDMACCRVSAIVNSPRNESPECILPA